jgi:pentatricopeptide repeat protein
MVRCAFLPARRAASSASQLTIHSDTTRRYLSTCLVRHWHVLLLQSVTRQWRREAVQRRAYTAVSGSLTERLRALTEETRAGRPSAVHALEPVATTTTTTTTATRKKRHTKTASELVEELRQVLACRHHTAEQVWRAYRAVARWRHALALLNKQDFTVVLTIIRTQQPVEASSCTFTDHLRDDVMRLSSAGALTRRVIQRTQKVIRDMRIAGHRLLGHEYAALISVYALHDKPMVAEAIFSECRKVFASNALPVCVYEAMMRTYLYTRQPSKALDLFNEAIRVGRSPSRTMCNMALHAHLQQGDLVRATILFESMQRNTLPSLLNEDATETSSDPLFTPTNRYSADIVTFNTMILGYLLARRIDRALDVVKQMKNHHLTPNRHTFHLLMRAYSHANDLRGFMDVWHQLAASEYGIDEEACGAALRLLERRMSPMAAVQQLFQHIVEANHHKQDNTTQQDTHWDSLIRRMTLRALEREKSRRSFDLARAAHLFRETQAQFIAQYEKAMALQDPLTPGFIKASLRGFAYFQTDAKYVGGLLRRMDQQGIGMAETTWIRLVRYVRSIVRKGSLDIPAEAHPSVHAILEALWTHAPQLSIVGYNLTLEVALAADKGSGGDASSAARIKTSVLDAMKRAGIRPNAATFGILAAWSSSLQELNNLLESLWRMDPRGAPSQLGVFAAAYHRFGDLPSTHQLFRQAREAGVATPYLYGMLMQAYRDVAGIRAVRRIHRLLALDWKTPDLIAYTILIDVLARFGRPVMADRVLTEIRALNLKPDLPFYTALLRGTFRLGHLNTVQQLLKIIEEDGFKVDARLATTLVAGYSRAKNASGTVQALTLFDKFYAFETEDTAIPSAANVLTWNALLSGLGRHPMTTPILDQLLDNMITGKHQNDIRWMATLEDADIPALSVIQSKTWQRQAIPLPNARSFKIVLGAHLRQQQWESVIYWWQRWKAFLAETASDAYPDTIAYAMVTQAHHASGQWEEAARLAQEASELGLLPNQQATTSPLSGKTTSSKSDGAPM